MAETSSTTTICLRETTTDRLNQFVVVLRWHSHDGFLDETQDTIEYDRAGLELWVMLSLFD